MPVEFEEELNTSNPMNVSHRENASSPERRGLSGFLIKKGISKSPYGATLLLSIVAGICIILSLILVFYFRPRANAKDFIKNYQSIDQSKF